MPGLDLVYDAMGSVEASLVEADRYAFVVQALSRRCHDFRTVDHFYKFVGAHQAGNLLYQLSLPNTLQAKPLSS
ncbi:hypothetical protein ED28_04840 [[Pantoea] beijingensis]|uniref:Uncharacterized protein n=1 Tax=[Pantoea] beijingensis TaxID=1324864 RepID=A0A443IGD7_9GAMM|nr:MULTISPECIES: hypothetical protein [Erwiniaceae]RWR03126.1 hypothetical protein ED28_04840 [[Pantoea] beijingensis]